MLNKKSGSFWLKSLVAGAALLAAATSAHAVPAGPAEPTQWPVSSYTLSQDGANNGWYNDNGNDLTDGAYGMTVGAAMRHGRRTCSGTATARRSLLTLVKFAQSVRSRATS